MLLSTKIAFNDKFLEFYINYQVKYSFDFQSVDNFGFKFWFSGSVNTETVKG